MAGLGLNFFATLDELAPGLQPIIERHASRLAATGSRPSPTPPWVARLDEAAIAQGGSLLVLPADVELVVRGVEQQRGGKLFFVDQLANPVSIVLRPSYRVGDDMLVAGSLSTVSTHPRAREMYARFARQLRRAFTPVRAYWLSPGALGQLEAGTRLVSCDTAPEQYDLKR